MKVLKAPEKIKIEGKSIFLAGSIEMGKAVDWQTKLSNKLEPIKGTILNPRRDDWDSSWTQSFDNKQFREQVEWELACQEKADIIAMYFDKDTESPISLLELGLFCKTGKMVVYCPEGFWKKGNIDVVCNKYKVEQASTFNDFIKKILLKLKKL